MDGRNNIGKNQNTYLITRTLKNNTEISNFDKQDHIEAIQRNSN